jgi:hypothetical protein
MPFRLGYDTNPHKSPLTKGGPEGIFPGKAGFSAAKRGMKNQFTF